MAQPIPLPQWPGDAEVAVSLTFDLDGDPAVPGIADPSYARRLSSRSYFRYGPARGLARVLDLLRRRQITATFYIPGATALAYPDAVRSIEADGHEIAHHGHLHLHSPLITPAEQREEIERGLDALQTVAGRRPRGYRSPAGELTPETLALLIEHGFVWDSSCMGDNRPYTEEWDQHAILELPFEWHLDDAPHFLSFGDLTELHHDPRNVMSQWWDEFEDARSERRLFTLVMHPEITGRGARIPALAALLDRMRDGAHPWFASHGQVADLVLAASSAGEH